MYALSLYTNSTKMGIIDCLYLHKPIYFMNSRKSHLIIPKAPSTLSISSGKRSFSTAQRPIIHALLSQSSKSITILIGVCGITFMSLVGASHAVEEPSNALSLPTWAVHVSSVVEWATAMALVWQYGEESGYESWKGLSWGMVPLLGGAFCACTWHFFYNAESLEVLVAIQAALTVIGNATMCIAAYRIYMASQERSNDL